MANDHAHQRQLVIDKNLTIDGPGANQLTVMRSTAAGIPNFRIFYISPGHIVTIRGLTINNGKAVPPVLWAAPSIW